MQTRFSLELVLGDAERLRLFQVFQYLAERQAGPAIIARELANHLEAGTEADAELRFADLFGGQAPGIHIDVMQTGAVRIYDIAGGPNLRMLCQIIAHVVPSVLPREFSFALIDEDTPGFSGGLVVMTATSAEIQTIDSMLARRGNQRLH
jgi:mannose/fructose-specific phosphotransferase system component IIA